MRKAIPSTLGMRLAATVLLVSAASLSAQTPVFTNTFNLIAGEVYDLPSADNLVRGGGINPLTGNIFYATRAGGSNHVTIVDGETGTLIGALDGTDVTGGTLHLLSAGAAADGAIYACNLAAAGSTLKVYRWESEQYGLTNPPVVIYEEPGVATRFGDTMDVRGSGEGTQIVIAGNGGNVVKILQPSDPTLTNAMWLKYDFTINTFLGRGITFGTGNVLYGKTGGNPNIFKVSFDVATAQATVTETINVGDNSFVGLDYYNTNGLELISGITYSTAAATTPTAHRAKVFQITGVSNAVVVLDDPLPQPTYAQGNGVGASGIGAGRVVFIEPNNSIPVYDFYLSSTVPPSISSNPGSETNLLAGGYTILQGAATGTDPLSYQWYKDGALVTGETSTSFALTNVTSAQSGEYVLVANNPYGSATSTVATVTVVPSAQSSVAERIWAKGNGDLFFLANDNTQRGLAYNPVSGNVIVVSRTPTNGVHVLDGNTGAYLRSLEMLNVGPVAGAVYDINMVAVADDGAIFVGSLTTTGNGFALFRWANDSAGTFPSQVYVGDPGIGRVGDTLTAAGSGVGTVIFASARNGKGLAVFTTFDGEFSWWPTAFTFDDLPDGFAGLGLYATATNQVWAKSGTFFLRKLTVNTLTGDKSVDAELAAGVNTMNAIAVDSTNGLAFGIVNNQTPDNVATWDIQGLTTTNDTPVLLDQDFFISDNSNINGTGQVDLDLQGSRVFALNSNNGILALKYSRAALPVMLEYTRSGDQLILNWSGAAVLQSAPSITGPWTDVQATGTHTYSGPETRFFRLKQ